MRNLPPAFKAQLESGVTTHCRCWRINRSIGDPLGFTDHDENISFGGVTFEASAGFETSDVERSLGLAIDNATASGVLRSDRITEEDIQHGVFDGAEVFQWVVDWRDPANRILNFRGEIGEIRRGEAAFDVELRGLSERLNRPHGRDFLHVCDALLGDKRCGVDVESVEYSGTGFVLGVEDARTLRVAGLNGYAEGWFDDGLITWSDGVLAERKHAVAVHRTRDGDVRLTLTTDLVVQPEIGDAFVAVAGCDKRLETCREKFANTVNYRGFPFIPGDTWVAAYPVEGGVYDGGSLG